MEAFKTHQGTVFPLNRDHIDTDQIIPKQFLTRIERTGFGQFVFYNWRFNDDGSINHEFQLDDEYSDSSILIAGENFGCGSSREHAPWALHDFGFKVIIAESFADIFYSNAFKNGILLIKQPKSRIDEWSTKDNLEFVVNLEEQTINDGKDTYTFDIDHFNKEKLLNGWDDISLTMQYEDEIAAYEQKKIPMKL